MNLIAVVPTGPNSYSEHEVECAHCKEAWQPSLPGPVMAGPFPKWLFPVKDYAERAGDVASAIRSLRRLGMRVGLPHQTADGVMFFQVDDYTLTVAQILELLDKSHLDRDGIRALAEGQKKWPDWENVSA
jgi:hypothetical protein